ncbi:hypothetical protein BD769DRAFT_1638454 [Suillus cothurnatus]|nr:hypothetical protein BD769DRAFT_1638454 [Suillus cothurnatus]
MCPTHRGQAQVCTTSENSILLIILLQVLNFMIITLHASVQNFLANEALSVTDNNTTNLYTWEFDAIAVVTSTP